MIYSSSEEGKGEGDAEGEGEEEGEGKLHVKSPLAAKMQKNNAHFINAVARCARMGIT